MSCMHTEGITFIHVCTHEGEATPRLAELTLIFIPNYSFERNFALKAINRD